MESIMVNLTPHAIVFQHDGSMLTVPPSGTVARCSVQRVLVGVIDAVAPGHGCIPVYRSIMGSVENEPLEIEGTVYIVSRIVAEAARRDDFLVPDDTVRDAEGRIIGCRALARV